MRTIFRTAIIGLNMVSHMKVTWTRSLQDRHVTWTRSLIDLQSDSVKKVDVTDISEIIVDTDSKNSRTIVDNVTPINVSGTDMKHKVFRHVNSPEKTRGYIAIEPTDFTYIGPDRATESISSTSQYLQIAEIIRHSGLPNYKQARIPIKSGLNIEAWKRHLGDYPDQKLIQYLQYRFPLSIKDPDSCKSAS